MKHHQQHHHHCSGLPPTIVEETSQGPTAQLTEFSQSRHRRRVGCSLRCIGQAIGVGQDGQCLPGTQQAACIARRGEIVRYLRGY